MAIKKVRERVHNGGTTGTEADYDVLHHETSEDLVINQVQSLSETGYKVTSGGLIEIWGKKTLSSSAHEAETTVTLPLEVNKVLNVQLSKEDSNAVDLSIKNITNTSFTIKGRAVTQSNGTSIGIGAVLINFSLKCI
ncbi:MAG: hypothetical protein J6D12_07560 [Peptostreptococcaceae bacterium]|nr:hypothetical protein [Peptostreptococcaceae bacterium]